MASGVGVYKEVSVWYLFKSLEDYLGLPNPIAEATNARIQLVCKLMAEGGIEVKLASAKYGRKDLHFLCLPANSLN